MGETRDSLEDKRGSAWSRFAAFLANLDSALTRILAIATTIGGIVVAVSQIFPPNSGSIGSATQLTTDSSAPSTRAESESSIHQKQAQEFLSIPSSKTDEFENLKVKQYWPFIVNTNPSCVKISVPERSIKNSIEKLAHRLACCQVFYSTVLRLHSNDERLHIFETHKMLYCDRTCADIRHGKLVRREVC